MAQRLPQRISPCPIQEAIIEVRFQTDTPADAVFGVVYGIARDSYPEYSRLAIVDIPEVLRPELPVQFHYQPHYHLNRPGFVCQVGPQVLSVVTQGEYPGWAAFRTETLRVFNAAKPTGLIRQVSRVGIRYLTLFDWNVLPELDAQLSIAGTDVRTQRMALQTYLRREPFGCTIRLSNLERTEDNGTRTLIDIDVEYLPPEGVDVWQALETILEDAHSSEKELFFALLTPEFLETLNPEYEEGLP